MGMRTLMTFLSRVSQRRNICKTLQSLAKASTRLNVNKCTFMTPEVAYLGCRIIHQGRSTRSERKDPCDLDGTREQQRTEKLLGLSALLWSTNSEHVFRSSTTEHIVDQECAFRVESGRRTSFLMFKRAAVIAKRASAL